jgi:hypothetical protein
MSRQKYDYSKKYKAHRRKQDKKGIGFKTDPYVYNRKKFSRIAGIDRSSILSNLYRSVGLCVR